MSTATIHTLAADARNCLEYGERPDGKTYLRLKAGSPGWVLDAVRAAHGDMFPNDWSYQFVADALALLSDGTRDPDGGTDDADTAYPMTADRLAWLASHLDRPAMCDDAAEEYDLPATTIMADRIGYGLTWEMQAAYNAVLAALERRLAAAGPVDG